MVKKSLLLMLLMAFVAPWAAMAQGTLPIGTGTSYSTSSSSATGSGSAMGNCYNYYSTSQFIYTAEELGGAKTINSIAFNHNAYSMSASVNIYLAHTTATTVDVNNPATGGTLVSTLSESSIGGSAEGWQTFNFSTPFEYNGTDNLLVIVSRSKYNSGWSNYLGWQYTATSDNKFMTRNSDGSGYDDITNTSYSYTAYANRPNVIIGYVLTTPYVTLDPVSATVITGSTTTLTATYGNVTGTPTITYTSSNEGVAKVVGDGTTATVTGMAPGTATITATMNYQGTDYTATCAVTVEEPSYCTPSFSNTSDYIKSFTTTGGEHNINNTNTGQGTGGYSDFYATHYVSAEAETEIEFSVVRGYDDTYQYGLWVDWNKDYVFDNSTELMASASSAQDWSSSFTIPAGTAVGDYRMRVLQVYSSSPTPCVSASWGEGEDYKLTVLAPSAYPKPQSLTVSDLTNISATISWTAPNENVTGYKYQYKPEGGEWSALTSTSALSAPLTGLTSNTNYTFQVKAVYGNGESEFASKDFTTLYCNPADMCVISYELHAKLYNNSYEYGWYYSGINVKDANTNEILDFWTVPMSGTTGVVTGTFAVCDGRELLFEWYAPYTYDSYFIDSYAIYDVNYEEITSGTGPMTTSVNYTMDCTPSTCPKPTDLTKGTPTAHQVQLSWTENGTAQKWQICINEDEEHLLLVNENPYTLGGLIGETDYTVKVRAYCDETDQSSWSNSVSFTTEMACAKPTNLEVTTVGAKNAVITWEGENDRYDLRYKKDITYHFEEGLGAWTSIDADGDGFGWLWSYSDNGITGHNGGYCLYSQSYDNNGDQVLYPDNYLVSPKVQLGGTISFYACAQDASWAAEHFGVAVSTSGNTNATDFTTIQEWTMTSDGTGTSGAKTMGAWGLFTVDLSAYEGEGYVAIRHFNCSDKFYLDVDDITILEPGQVVDWTVVENITEKPYTLPELQETTTYEVQVRGYCTGEELPSAWTNSITFTTLSGNVFVTEGNWNVAANWQGGEVPAAGSNVIIAANAIVPAGYTADAGNVTFENSATLTVADGGQFKTTYAGVNVTMQKHINGTDFGSPENPTNAGYYLIANPVSTAQVPATIGMTANDYDLYYFDNSQTGEQWRNYKDNTFNLGNTTGYLYANSNGFDISFTGEANVTSITKKVELTYSSGEFGGFCLVGNPYTCNAYLADGRAFYVMNIDGDEIIPATSNVITPMMGLFVEITDDDNINFTTTAPVVPEASALNINLTSRNAQVDRAIVNFGKGNSLNKFQLNPNHTKLYIPQDNDYAVVYSEENQGEMPVSFKAEKNGTYTLGFNTENIEFSYLHLIDNMTGNDVNLLETPSYTFEARTTDYASRFRLVFATGSSASSETFSFVNAAGNLCIFGIEGEATLQVMDVNGRMISSNQFSGSYESKLNVAPGVYMLRLINGNDVKVQKMVVR